MFTHEEKQELKSIIDAKLKPVNDKLDTLLRAVNLLTEGAISTVTGVDEINDKAREKNNQNKTQQ
jgi:hypothetical protein